jgi:STE24 endopeptidase
VIVWDTLLKRFPIAQIRVVLAHEFGHLSRNHLWKDLAWMALLLLPIALVVELVTRRRGGLYEPTAVPLAIFVVTLLLFLVTPLQTAFSRRLESEADWIALQTTHDPAAMQGLFRRLSRLALVQPDPPGWAKPLMEDHPTVMERIEMAEAWRERH